jgi:pimeloyl-ACP methyl ester carboxylesterase
MRTATSSSCGQGQHHAHLGDDLAVPLDQVIYVGLSYGTSIGQQHAARFP